VAHVHVESEIVARKNRAVPKACALTEPDADPCAPCGGASGSARSRPETAAPSSAAWRVGAPGAARPQSSSNLTSIGNSQYNPSQNSIYTIESVSPSVAVPLRLPVQLPDVSLRAVLLGRPLGVSGVAGASWSALLFRRRRRSTIISVGF
jgi:hypothetical protein